MQRAVYIWDWCVRLSHWGLVALTATAVFTGFFAGAPWIDLHVWVGAAIGFILIIRVIWGFCGGRYARFTDFIRSPQVVFQHLGELRSGRVHHYLGHNPLGGLMVIALMATLAVLVASGLAVWGGVFKHGPFASFVTFDLGQAVRSFHEWNAIALLGLIGLHLAGVAFESWRSQENLPRSMVTGWKQTDDPLAQASHGSLPVVAVLAAGILVGMASLAWTSLSSLPVKGLPASTDAVVNKECAACHMAYPASLLPKASWGLLMAQLDDHFGENASLPDALSVSIRQYLETHSAEQTDTKAANRFRLVAPDKPYQVTAAPFWLKTHRDIPVDVFVRQPIGSKSNCAACHQDTASGLFYPGNIRIPSLQVENNR